MTRQSLGAARRSLSPLLSSLAVREIRVHPKVGGGAGGGGRGDQAKHG